MSDPLRIPCPACTEPMARVEVVDEPRVKLDTYRCNREACGRKAVVVFEPEGGLSEPEQSFVEREIARRGAFFPSDFTGSHGTGRFGR